MNGMEPGRPERHDRHPDVEYIVAVDRTERVFDAFDEALVYAFATGLSGAKIVIDVLIYSEDGARAFGGDDAADEYRDDSEASVFRRFELAVEDHGSVP
jgi:hypothetical protein